MSIYLPLRRAQVYCFLANAFLYPTENWLEDLSDLIPIINDLELNNLQPTTYLPDGKAGNLQLSDLQAAHRQTFGLTGSLCYETELGMPNEYRQSQEMADIAGFYRAFGFRVGGAQRERPDHLATELEFLYVLSLKEAYAAERGIDEHVEVCVEARRSFLRDHLGQWIGLFAQSVARGVGPDRVDNPYLWLSRLAAAVVHADAFGLGLSLADRRLGEVQPTPLGPDISCETCPANTLSEE
jgi:nitrate reductase assembly molybdenum cofactor insertion protein NarJ